MAPVNPDLTEPTTIGDGKEHLLIRWIPVGGATIYFVPRGQRKKKKVSEEATRGLSFIPTTPLLFPPIADDLEVCLSLQT